MKTLTGVQITKAFGAQRKDKTMIEGENEYGAWKLWHVYIDDPDWTEQKFGYMQGAKQSIPERGMEVTIDFEVEEDGQYTNYNIKKMTPKQSKPVPEKPKPKPKPAPGKPQPALGRPSGFAPMSMYVSYAKDLQVARIAKMSGDSLTTYTLTALVNEVAVEGKRLFDLVEGGGEPEKKEAPPEEDSPFPPENDEPFPGDRF